MKTIIGGGLALIIGVPSLAIFLPALGNVLAGILPVLLILGGSLAAYLGYEDLKAQQEPPPNPTPEPAPKQDTLPQEAPKAPEAAAPEETGKDYVLVGNTDSLVFHKPDCKFAQSKKCTQTFTSREQAMDQGYKPCKVCSP